LTTKITTHCAIRRYEHTKKGKIIGKICDNFPFGLDRDIETVISAKRGNFRVFGRRKSLCLIIEIRTPPGFSKHNGCNSSLQVKLQGGVILRMRSIPLPLGIPYGNGRRITPPNQYKEL
jgi:hypothetical protein